MKICYKWRVLAYYYGLDNLISHSLQINAYLLTFAVLNNELTKSIKLDEHILQKNNKVHFICLFV